MESRRSGKAPNSATLLSVRTRPRPEAILPHHWLSGQFAPKAHLPMTTALYLILSGILIGAGISIIWRDVRKQSRGSFISERDVRGPASHDVEVTIARGADPEPAHAHPRAVGAAMRAPLIGPASGSD